MYVLVPLFPDVATGETVTTEEKPATVTGRPISSIATLSEVRPLVSGGVSIMTYNVFSLAGR